MSAFAEVDDYIKRYGADIDSARVEVLLEDASNFLKALYAQQWGADYEKGIHPTFDDNACAVVCAIVSRSLNVPAGMEGVSQASQGADVYSASFTFANPTGDFYISKSDKQRLGLGGCVIGTIAPLIHKEECNYGVL